MSKNRNKVGEADRRFIIGRSGGRCNKCRREVFAENDFGEKARLGDDAHIIASSDLGPRGKSEHSTAVRGSAQNLVLLCKTCHSEVDQQPRQYSETRLAQIREDHYSWVEASLGGEIRRRPRFHYLTYINIPRADMYAVVNSIVCPSFEVGAASSIRDLGLQAGRLMASYTHILNHEELYANEFADDTKIEQLAVGSYWFSSPANFRSKKIHNQPDLVAAWSRLESVIYRKFVNWRLLCLIDPRWITTCTAYSIFNGGTMEAMALVHINAIDLDKRIAKASPLFIGAPDVGGGI